MIPRLGTLAPRLEPFPADTNTIGIILSTTGLSVRYIDPITNQLKEMDRENYREICETLGDVEYESYPVVAPETVTEPDVPPTNPTPNPPAQNPPEPNTPQQAQNTTNPADEKGSDFQMKPITNDDTQNGSQNNGNNNGGKHNGKKK